MFAACTSILLTFGCSTVPSSQSTLDLQGEWNFALDRSDVGIAEQWFDLQLPDSIKLPGSLQEQGYGDPPSTNTPWLGTLYDKYWYLRAPYKKHATPDNFKIPYWLQPARHYVGTAWYSRSFDIPESWEGRRFMLYLERVHWSSTVWIDGQKIGFDDSLSAPHVYDLGDLAPGQHTLSVRVDNRMLKTIREDAHAITDSTQSNWNGIIGRMELIAKHPVYIADTKVITDIEAKTVTFKVTIENTTQQEGEGILSVGEVEQPVSWTAEGAEAELTVRLPKDALLWDEFTPALHPFTLTLSGVNAQDEKTFQVGLRKPESRDTLFYFNGRRAFFRGNHEGCQFPLTGYPATDVASWKAIFETVKSYGLNHVRFHSWCPPEAAFTAADELGLYLQPECSNWGQYGAEKEEMIDWVERETQKIIDTYGNHPSFVLFSTGNEPAGSWQEPLLDWTRRWKEQDPRRLYTSQTGRYFGTRPGPVDDIDYLVAIRIGTYRFRGDQGWHGKDFSASLDGVNYPVISHETGQWCAFPDFSEIEKYTGSFKARNFEIFRESMKEKGLLDMADKFLLASGTFQLECYKQEIEALLRTPGMGGFQLLDLHDYPGQGTALVGLLNVFWESKGYATPEQFRRFCNVTVPLARLTKTIYRTDETLTVPLEIAHFGTAPIEGAIPYWSITDADGITRASAKMGPMDIPIGNATSLGELSVDLSTFSPNQKCVLTVGLEGTMAENDWEFWVYPAEDVAVPEEDVVVTRSYDEALDALSSGGKVLWIPDYNELSWDCPPIGRLPIFWSRLMGPKWERFLGIWCNPEHPALKDFTTDAYYDWQWQDVIIPYFRAVNLDNLPFDLKPIVQVIDDWNRNYKLAAVVECRVGSGKLMICAPDLEKDLDKRPVARQLRNSLLSYMNSDQFNPSVDVTTDQLSNIFFDNMIMRRLGARAEASSETQKREVENLIDGNPNSYWLSAFGGAGHPHEVTIALEKAVPFSGLMLMNRQDQRAHEGDIRKYEILISDGGEQWSTVATGTLESTFDPQRIDFGKTVTASQLKLRAISGYGEDTVASLAEIAVLYEGPKLVEELNDVGPYKKVVSATKEMDEDIEYVNKFIERITASGETTPAINVQDGDKATCWSAEFTGGEAWITLKLNRPVILTGISYLPKQDDEKGRLKEYVVEVSADGRQWTEAATGQFAPGTNQQSVEFGKPAGGSALRLRVLSSQDGKPVASAAEIDIQAMD